MTEKPREIKERTFAFSVRVVRLCQVLDGAAGVPRTLAGQLLRAGTSIGANVEEAYGGQSKADFTAKMYIACKEAREAHYWLRLLAATDLLPPAKLDPITDEANQLVAILTTITKNSRQK